MAERECQTCRDPWTGESVGRIKKPDGLGSMPCPTCAGSPAEREWTTEVPGEPGWYWLAAARHEPFPVLIYEWMGALYATAEDFNEPLEDVSWHYPHHLWGPRLTPPPPPTEDPSR